MNDKEFHTLAAEFASKGHRLSRFTDDENGAITYFVSRLGMFREFTTLEACRAFLAVIGGAA